MNRVTEAVARPTRTGLQAGVAYAAVEFTDAFLFDMSDRQYGAALALGVIVFGWIQVTFEDYIGKGLLRRIEPRTTPVVDSKGD